MDTIFQHFRKEEHDFIEQVFEYKRYVEDFYAPKLMDFLDPRQVKIVESIIGKNEDVQFLVEGGFNGRVERLRGMLYPSYMIPVKGDFELQVLGVRYASKFVQLKHPDVLGALLHLGLDRTKFGDIRINSDMVQFVVAREVADYVRANLTTIGKSKATVIEVDEQDLIGERNDPWVESVVTTSSLRLDTVIASCYPAISRQKATMLIEAGRVKVNYTVREQNSFELQEHDLLSIRGVGRLVLLSIEGHTKKEKIRLKIGKIERK